MANAKSNGKNQSSKTQEKEQENTYLQGIKHSKRKDGGEVLDNTEDQQEVLRRKYPTAGGSASQSNEGTGSVGRNPLEKSGDSEDTPSDASDGGSGDSGGSDDES